MRLCGIIPDLTHYYGELGATIRAWAGRGWKRERESRDRLFLVEAQCALYSETRAKRTLLLMLRRLARTISFHRY